MAQLSAIHVAVEMVRNPVLVKAVKAAPLPQGMTLLLEVAAGEVSPLAEARRSIDLDVQTLREAAGFFVEQVLLDTDSDSYRVLGAPSNAPQALLRRHMALLAKWLHPDVVDRNSVIDRSIFAPRVTDAWEALKTADRRAKYDRQRHAACNHASNGAATSLVPRFAKRHKRLSTFKPQPVHLLNSGQHDRDPTKPGRAGKRRRQSPPGNKVPLLIRVLGYIRSRFT